MEEDKAEQAWQVLREADRLYTKTDVENVLSSLAEQICNKLKDSNPIVVCVLNGGIVPFGILLPQLQFPLQADYLHATRYGTALAGGELDWISKPCIAPKGRTVLLIEDILDEGLTLAAIENYYRQEGAKEIYKVVLIVKDRDRSVDVTVDFVGLTVPNRYVFGYGMDYKGYLRNAPGIFALKE